MEYFCVKLAGIPIGVTCQFLNTEKRCRKYVCTDKPWIQVQIKEDDIHLEKDRYFRSSNYRENFPEWYYEFTVLLRLISDALVPFHVFLMHGSAIEVDEKGYIFTAKSGVGKSTHAALWNQELKRLGHVVHMINDDKPFIKLGDDVILICGNPWSGKHLLDTNSMVPLQAIGKIERNETNVITKLSENVYWTTMLQQCYLPGYPEAVEQVLSMIQKVIEKIPCYKIQCNMSPNAAHVSWAKMKDS